MRPLRILLTRPRDESEALAQRLIEHFSGTSIKPLIAPMLEIVPRPDAAPSLDDAQAILLTSANGARALAGALGPPPAGRNTPVLAVGEATARAAREAGFASVESAAGDVTQLAGLVATRLMPEAGPLLHVAGTAVAGDLAGDLTARGFSVRRAVLYEARRVDALPREACQALEAGEVDVALFFSPRSAETFVKLIHGDRLEWTTRRIVAVCLSETVAEAARALAWQHVCVAARPDQAALIDALAQQVESLRGVE